MKTTCIDWVADHITTHACWVFFGSLVFLGFFICFLPQLQSRADVDDWTVDGDADVAYLKEFKSLFPKQDFFVVAYQEDDLFRENNLTILRQITRDLQELVATGEAEDVISLANVNDIIGTDDTFTVQPFLGTIPATPEGLSALRRRALSNPLYLKNLVSIDGRTAALVVFVYDRPTDVGYRQRLIEAVEVVLARYQPGGHTFHVAGWPITNVSLAKSMIADVVKFFPLSFLCVWLTIWCIYRNVRLLCLAGICILMTVLATLGLNGLLHFPLNNVTVAMVPLVMSLALSDTIYLFTHLDRRVLVQYPERRRALAAVLREVMYPGLITAIFTGVGFISLTTNSVPVIRSFGWLGTAGMFFEYICSFGLMAPLLLLFRPETIYHDVAEKKNRVVRRFLHWGYRVVQARYILALACCTTVLLLAGLEIRKLQVDTTLVQFFWKSDPLRQDMDFVKANLGGVQPLDIAIAAQAPDAFKEPANLRAVEQLADQIRALPGVDCVLSLTDFFKKMHQAFHGEEPAYYRLPETHRLIEQYLLLYDADDLDTYVTPRFDHVRLAVRVQEDGSRAGARYVRDIERLIRELHRPDLRMRITGLAFNQVKTAEAVVHDQLLGLGEALIVIWLLTLVILRSFTWATFSIVPNMFPIMLNFGIMGAAGIPVDTGTSIIAASAFGIIVDVTTRIFIAYRDLRQRGVSILQALAEIVDLKAEAVISCVFVLSMGFSIFLLSRFVPIFQFGLLNLLILLGGIAGKLFFMGSLTVWVARWREPTGIVSAPSQVTTEPLPLDLASSLGDNQRR